MLSKPSRITSDQNGNATAYKYSKTFYIAKSKVVLVPNKFESNTIRISKSPLSFHM